MFMGTYFLNMDDSHRLNIPASYKRNLESDLVLSRGIDQDKKCIYLYNRTDWDKFANQLRSLSMLKKGKKTAVLSKNYRHKAKFLILRPEDTQSFGLYIYCCI